VTKKERTTTQCSHSGPGGRGRHHLPWLLWLAVAYPFGQWVKGRLLSLGCQRCEGGWYMPTLFLSSLPLWCCGLRCSWGPQAVASACLRGVCGRSGRPQPCAARLGGALVQHWCLWLVKPRPAAGERCYLGNGAGQKILWFLAHKPPRQGSAVQQAVSKASTSFWSALHDVPLHHWPAVGCDAIDPDHPYLSVLIQVTLRTYLADMPPP
jgi:hypothetical protein